MTFIEMALEVKLCNLDPMLLYREYTIIYIFLWMVSVSTYLQYLKTAHVSVPYLLISLLIELP